MEEEKQQMAKQHKEKMDEAKKNLIELTAENAEKQSVLLKAIASEGKFKESKNFDRLITFLSY